MIQRCTVETQNLPYECREKVERKPLDWLVTHKCINSWVDLRREIHRIIWIYQPKSTWRLLPGREKIQLHLLMKLYRRSLPIIVIKCRFFILKVVSKWRIVIVNWVLFQEIPRWSIRINHPYKKEKNIANFLIMNNKIYYRVVN